VGGRKNIEQEKEIRGVEKYLIRWKGFMAEGDTWERKENLKNVEELIEEFKQGEVSRSLTVDSILFFLFIFILLFFSFSFNFLFLEQLRLGVISHAVTSVTT